MTTTGKMICPDCGVEMNQHAEKIDYTAGLNDPQAIDLVFGGVVEEVHTCPHCGRTELKRVIHVDNQPS